MSLRSFALLFRDESIVLSLTGLQASGLEYTFIRVGEVVEGKEGGAATASNVTDELPIEQVVRDDIVRLSAESFMMENATNKVI